MARNVLSRLLLGASLATIATTAQAQAPIEPPATAPVGRNSDQTQQAGASTSAAVAADARAQAGTGTVGDIIVTGSRVVQNGNNAPTPITIVSTQQVLETRPGNLSDAINDLPIFSGSRGQNGNPGNGTTNNSGNLQNLRALGYPRTLVLWDGHRLPATTQDQLVDTDMIPQLLLQRVDIVTGGTSAVYGSDAITGVVNFVTDTKFKGIKAQLQQGISQYGDGRSFDGGLAVGTELFGGRGHFEASYQYRDDRGVLSRTDRPFGTHQYTVQGGGTAANPYHLIDNTRISTTTFGGLIRSGALAGQKFGTDSVLTPFVNGAATGTNGYQSGGDGGYYNGSIRGTLSSHQAFARFDYEVTDSIKAYVEGSYTRNHTLNYGQYNVITNATISASNPFLPVAYRTQLAAAGQSTFTFSRLLADMTRINTDGHTDQYFLNAGLSGDLGGTFKWNVFGTHSAAKLVTANSSNVDSGRLAAALDTVVSPTSGQTVCRASLTNSAYAGCVPLNPFGPTAASAAALGYISQKTSFTTRNTLDDIEGTISGAPFGTWAGPVNLALTGEVRHLTFKVDSDALPSDFANCAGIAYNCTATTFRYADATVANRSKVSLTVYELAGEAEVPLLRDVPFTKDLSANLAGRYTYYDTTGSAWTYKAGLDWNITDELKLRGSYSRDIRAPNLYDLYQPSTTNNGSFTDLLTGQSPTVPVTVGGNTNLKPEVGRTIAAGIVVKPAFLRGFTASVDFYNITVTNAVTSIQGTNPSIQVACYASGGTSPYCALQTRPLGFTNTSAANAVTSFTNTVINIAKIKTKGVDVEAGYSTRLFDNPFSIRGFMTYQPHIIYYTPGLVTIDTAGVAFSANALQPSPKIRATIFVNYKAGPVSLGISERWRSKLDYTGDPTQIVSSPRVPSVAYTNLNLAFDAPWGGDHTAQFFVNVQNLFNKQPPPVAGIQSNGAVGTFGGFAYGDDPIGRYFTVGVRGKF